MSKLTLAPPLCNLSPLSDFDPDRLVRIGVACGNYFQRVLSAPPPTEADRAEFLKSDLGGGARALFSQLTLAELHRTTAFAGWYIPRQPGGEAIGTFLMRELSEADFAHWISACYGQPVEGGGRED